MTHLLLASFITKPLLIVLVIGLLAGLLAQAITPGRGYGFLASILIGIVGGWLGDKFLGFIHINTGIPFINEVIHATLGAIILVLLLNLIAGKDKRDKTAWKA